MKAMAVKAPFAWAIIFGGKDVENCSSSTNIRGRTLVYASKTFSMDEYDRVGSLLDKRALAAFPDASDLQSICGHVIGSVELWDCVDSSKSRWYVARQVAWLLRDARPMQPMAYAPLRGAVRWHNVSDNLVPMGHAS